MAKVILNPIGKSISTSTNVYKDWLENMAVLEKKLDKKRSAAKLGWGEKYQQRVRQKGKMTAWERVNLLADDTMSIFSLNSFV
ncbi:MAG: hypothetical protein O2897_05095, partial [bacterium]|nr:hypothetical protein [bacterium]